jgi:dATP pyrophosphohydrolase
MGRRADLVDVWLYRGTREPVDVLLLHRAPGRPLPGLWQGVSGLVVAGESMVEAARREVMEETGFGDDDTEARHHLDYVAEFLWERTDALLTSVYFAFRIRPGRDPVLSHEHDAFRWVPLQEAIDSAVWPGYREGLERLRANVLDPARARWFELGLDEPGA